MSGTSGTLEAAGAYLEAARAEFEAFAEGHPDGMTEPIAQAWDLTASALGHLPDAEESMPV